MTSPFSASGVIDSATCRLLVEAYDSSAPYAASRDQHGNPLVQWSDRYLSRFAATTLLEVVRLCQRLTAGAYGPQVLYPETVLLALLRDGQGHVPHADNEKLVDDEWVLNHTPQRDFAGILYLNSAFAGGELRFDGDESWVFHPTGGLYVSFPCDRRFVHQVTPVVRGRRYSLALWYTCSHSSANFGLVYALNQLPPLRERA